MFLRRASIVVCVSLSWAACAFPDIQFQTETSDDTGTPGPTGGGSTAVGGSTVVGGAGGTTDTGGGGVGGEPVCVPGEVGSCGDGMKCSVSGNGFGCVTAGTRPAWTRCFGDGDCTDGTYCDGPTSVCHPICQNAAECAGQEAQCIPAVNGMKICSADCHPMTGAPCSDAHGLTTCYYDVADSLWDCVRTSGLTPGTACNTVDTCQRGSVCAGMTCRSWCTNIGELCGFATCNQTNPPVSYHATPYGICIPL